MNVIAQGRPEQAAIPGIQHATWAGRQEGLQQLSLWRQTMSPGAATPEHSHDCDEVVLCLSGWGELHIDGTVQHFGADSTLVLPRGVAHQIINVGPMPLQTIGIFGSSPVITYDAGGAALALPWRS